MTEERKHEIESIIDNALTEKDCKEWAAGNMTDNVAALVKQYNIKRLNIWDDVCEIVEFYPEPTDELREEICSENKDFVTSLLVDTYENYL